VLGADLAVLGALVGRGIWPCRARWAGLGVGFGSGGRAELGWARVWSTLYMSSSCLHDVFVFIFMCISDMYLCWARIWLCWARWLGVGFGRAGRAGLGWA